MTFCTRCGLQATADARFCARCGSLLASSAHAAGAPAPKPTGVPPNVGSYPQRGARNPVPHRGPPISRDQQAALRSTPPAASEVARPGSGARVTTSTQPPTYVTPMGGPGYMGPPRIFVAFSGEAGSLIREFIDRFRKTGVVAHPAEWEPPTSARLSLGAQQALGTADGLIFFNFGQNFRADRFEALAKGLRHQPPAPVLTFRPRARGQNPPVLVDFHRAFDPAILARMTGTSPEEAHRMGSMSHSLMDIKSSFLGPRLLNAEFVDRMAQGFASACLERTHRGP
jgi:hypothetical protein